MEQQKLQLVFEETIKLKITAKEIKKMISDALQNSKSYTDCKQRIDIIRTEMRVIRVAIENEFTKDLEKLDNLKIKLGDQKMMTTDVALTKLMNGETVEVVDHYGWVYEPVWSVKFKKTGIHQDINTGERKRKKINK